MEDNTIKSLLDGEIQKTLIEVNQLKTGTDEAIAAMVKLQQLYAQKIKQEEVDLKERIHIDDAITDSENADLKKQELELRKAELDARAAQVERENQSKLYEMALRDDELRQNKIQNAIHIVLDLLAIIVPVGVSSYWMSKGLKFEESGTYTSRTGQWLSNHMRLFSKKG